MTFEPLHLGLLLGGWTAAFLLGSELQSGFNHWRRQRLGARAQSGQRRQP